MVTRHIRASKLPLASICPAALATIDEVNKQWKIPLDVSGEPAALGRAYHEIAEKATTTNVMPADLVLQVAQARKVDAEELARLVRIKPPRTDMGKPTWVVAEHQIGQQLASGGILTGTLDLAIYWKEAAFLEVHDYKTGWLAVLDEADAPDNDQLKAYASVMAMQVQAGGERVERVHGSLIKVRAGREEEDYFEWTGDRIEQEWRAICHLADQTLLQFQTPPEHRSYRVGAHCRHEICRRNCVAYRHEMDTAVSLVQKGELLITTENAPEIYEKRKLLSKVVKDLDTALKETVEIMGPITRGAKVLEFRENQQKSTPNITDFERALWDVLNYTNAVPKEVRTQLVDAVLARTKDKKPLLVKRFGLYKKPKRIANLH